jgi:ribosomal subunit interface protein
MKINVKTTGIELTPAISSYVEEKIEQISKFLDPNDETLLCNVEIGMSTKHHQSGDIFRAELNIRTESRTIRAVSEKEDLYIAINDAKEEIIREISSRTKKDRGLFRRGAKQIKNIVRGFGRKEK